MGDNPPLLWDQTAAIIKHVNEGLWMSDLTVKFHNEASKLFTDLSKNLKKLCEKYKKQVKQRVYAPGHGGTLNVLQAQINQFDVIADFTQIQQTAMQMQAKNLKTQCDTLRQQITQRRTDLSRAEDILQTNKQHIDQLTSKYQDSHRDLLRCQDMFAKAKENVNLSHQELDKMEEDVNRRDQEFLNEGNNYQREIEKFNTFQREHYRIHLGNWIDLCIKQDEERCNAQVEFSLSFSNYLEGMSERFHLAAENIKENSVIYPDKDWMNFTKLLTTNKSPPADLIPIELRSRTNSNPANDNQSIISKLSLTSTNGQEGIYASVDPVPLTTTTTTASPPNSATLPATSQGRRNILSKLFRRGGATPAVASASVVVDNGDSIKNKITAPLNVTKNEIELQRNESSTELTYDTVEADSNNIYSEMPTYSSTPFATAATATTTSTLQKFCVAIYALDADETNGVLAMQPQQRFIVLQEFVFPDWHQVSTLDGSASGVVPANYVTVEES